MMKSTSAKLHTIKVSESYFVFVRKLFIVCMIIVLSLSILLGNLIQMQDGLFSDIVKILMMVIFIIAFAYLMVLFSSRGEV